MRSVVSMTCSNQPTCLLHMWEQLPGLQHCDSAVSFIDREDAGTTDSLLLYLCHQNARRPNDGRERMCLSTGTWQDLGNPSASTQTDRFLRFLHVHAHGIVKEIGFFSFRHW